MNKKYLIGIAGIYILLMYTLIKLKQDVAANDFNFQLVKREYICICSNSYWFSIICDFSR